MLGAIAGDVIGSPYEARPTKRTDFPLFSKLSKFTDDTVLTVAVGEWLLDGGSLVDLFHKYFAAYKQAGYGGRFIRWAGHKKREPYNSWGNGSAMRASPVGGGSALRMSGPTRESRKGLPVERWCQSAIAIASPSRSPGRACSRAS